MIYRFKDIYNDKMYDNTRVMFTTGKYAIFSNYVADRLKETCRESDEYIADESISEEFGLASNDNSGDNVVSFSTFLSVSSVPNVNGKWYCSVDLDMLNKKDKSKLEAYIKKPSQYGVLVVTSSDWKDYRYYLNNRAVKASNYTNLIQLSFPSRKELGIFIKERFKERKHEVEDRAVEYFIMKMSDAYDEYDKTIELVCAKCKSYEISASQMKELMKGIEHFNLESFIIEITKPLSSNKTTSKKVYRMMAALVDEYGARNLASRISREVDKVIDFRIMINNGTIPVEIKYFFSDVIGKLGDENKYSKMSEWKFRRTAMLAAQTSLRDWEYISIILKKALSYKGRNSEYICKRALYDVVTRSVLSPSRVDNIIGVDNIIEDGLRYIDKFRYIDKNEEKAFG